MVYLLVNQIAQLDSTNMYYGLWQAHSQTLLAYPKTNHKHDWKRVEESSKNLGAIASATLNAIQELEERFLSIGVKLRPRRGPDEGTEFWT